jgi:hypothetical protein
MSLELWKFIAPIATFVVLAAGTIAALIQLVHLRSTNQLQALINLGQELQQMASHIGWVNHELPQKMQDPAFRHDVGVVVDPKHHPELLVALFMEECGQLVKMKVMPERFIMEYSGGADAIAKCWTNLQDVIAIRRRELPNSYQNFEFLVVRARKWLERYPHGTYPANEPRIQLTDRWARDERP